MILVEQQFELADKFVLAHFLDSKIQLSFFEFKAPVDITPFYFKGFLCFYLSIRVF
jgi:hypothetical protein